MHTITRINFIARGKFMPKEVAKTSFTDLGNNQEKTPSKIS